MPAVSAQPCRPAENGGPGQGCRHSATRRSPQPAPTPDKLAHLRETSGSQADHQHLPDLLLEDIPASVSSTQSQPEPWQLERPSGAGGAGGRAAVSPDEVGGGVSFRARRLPMP
jgi:hypothetical protein